jgi:hypothetical protein
MKPHDPPASSEGSNDAPARKGYEKPQLQVYGDLAQIAKAVAGSKQGDGQAHPNKHFTS